MPRGASQGPLRSERTGVLTVALVDGVPMFRDGLSALIHRTPGMRWVGAAERANTALQLCERFRPDVMLVDSGVDPRNHIGHMLAGADPRLAVLVLVAEPQRTTQYVASALAAGAHGVILRSAEPGQLISAIRTVHVERRYLDAALTPTLSAPRARLTHLPGPVQQPLSRREYQVLQLIADGLENQAIAKILFVSVETIRTHVKSILRKLAARDRTHAVAVAFRLGVLAPEETRPDADGTNGDDLAQA
jgi:DNA-binding NarL/FixJ family response regulator